MANLTVSLPDALTAYLQEQITAGHYNTADDYIQALIQQDKARKEHLEPLLLESLASGEATSMIASIQQGLESVGAGQTRPIADFAQEMQHKF
jgi:antitoxin ParD1/3/4